MQRVAVLSMAVCITGPGIAFALPSVYGDFDWRKNDGNWVTPIRNQGPCGSCWAFGATAALESQFLINAGTPGMELDLAEQHLLSDGGGPNRLGSCRGGLEFRATSYFVSDGITDEATLPYLARDTSPLWPLQEPYTLYKTDAVKNFIPGGNSTQEIKRWLEETGPLTTFFDTVDWFTPPATLDAMGAAEIVAADFDVPEYYVENGAGGLDLGGNPGFHSVAVVGYRDDATVARGGYWIVKNSWGSGWGDDGFGFIEYGDIEKYNRTHAITGATFTEYVGDAPPPEPVPEPAAIVVWLALAATTCLLRPPRFHGGLATKMLMDRRPSTEHRSCSEM